VVFIAVSGPDGSGKTALCQRLVRQGSSSFQGAPISAVAPLDPAKALVARVGGLPTPEPRSWHALQDWAAGFFCLCLRQTAERAVLPRLEHGGVVVADKWIEDLRISQAYFGVDLDQWAAMLARLPRPDLTVVLCGSVDALVRRLRSAGRHGPGSRRDYLEYAVAAYRALPRGPGWLHLDGAAGTDDNADRVRREATAVGHRTSG
jgi:thymidylate kinase